MMFQRRHFNWMVDLMVELDLNKVQEEWMIVRLSETNVNFKHDRFRAALQAEKDRYEINKEIERYE